MIFRCVRSIVVGGNSSEIRNSGLGNTESGVQKHGIQGFGNRESEVRKYGIMGSEIRNPGFENTELLVAVKGNRG